jgi:hypothetical protein
MVLFDLDLFLFLFQSYSCLLWYIPILILGFHSSVLPSASRSLSVLFCLVLSGPGLYVCSLFLFTRLHSVLGSFLSSLSSLSIIFQPRLVRIITTLHLYSTSSPIQAQSTIPPIPPPILLPSTDRVKNCTMCYKLVERYSVCKCLYFQHSVDPCQAYGQRGHSVEERTVLVGYVCETHSTRGSSSSPTAPSAGKWLDSGYSSEKGSCR